MMYLYITLAIILLIIVILYFIFDDFPLLVQYLFNRKRIKYFCLRKMKKGDQEIIILGTFHELHFHNQNYTLKDIKAVLDHTKPELVLVESRQEEIERGNLADGPLEMLYTHLHAKEQGILVRGVDYWTMEKFNPGTTNDVRDTKMTENIVREAENYKKVLVVIGATHMLIDSKKLKKLGYKRKRITKKEKVLLFKHDDKKATFPKGAKDYVSKRVEFEKDYLENHTLDEKWENALKRIINFLPKYQDMIEEE